MSGPANLSESAAMLRTRYQDGKPQALVYSETQIKLAAVMNVRTDHKDDFLAVPVATERPQGSGGTIPIAQGSVQQTKYLRYQVGRMEHFGVARVKGQALRVAEGKEASLANVWSAEVDGIMATEMLNHEIYLFGNGSGVLAQLSGTIAAATTITLNRAADVAKLAIGMRVGAVSDSTLNPTVRPGFAIITAISRGRTTATISSGTAFDAQLPGLTNTDYFVRYGDNASGGTRSYVIAGVQVLFEGGTSPSALQGLTRTSDPVRLAGQTASFAGWQIEDAMVEMIASVLQQGGRVQDSMFVMPIRTMAKLKKQQAGRIIFERQQVKGREGTQLSFSALTFQSDEGEIPIITSPFCDIDEIGLFPVKNMWIASAGDYCSIQNYSTESDAFVLPADDGQETRIASYDDAYTNRPIDAFRATGMNPDT